MPAVPGPDYFDHDADIGVIGRGASVEAAFEAAAAAMFALMAEPAQLEPQEDVRVDFDEPDIELALVRWLNALLAQARRRGLALCRFRLRREDGHWHGLASGQPWDDSLDRGVEVKGATLTALRVREDARGVEARCVVDV